MSSFQARRAAELSSTGHIGVIGTQGTILSQSYVHAIKALRPQAQIYAQPCPLFVPLAEEGWQGHEATRLIVESYLAPFKDTKVDTLVMGCTHYPILADDIQTFLGPDIRLVHSGEAMWQMLKESERALPAPPLRNVGILQPTPVPEFGNLLNDLWEFQSKRWSI